VGDATANLAAASFTADTAEKTGQSERKVRRDAQRGEEIGAAADVNRRQMTAAQRRGGAAEPGKEVREFYV
jgi:hypothetical protein